MRIIPSSQHIVTCVYCKEKFNRDKEPFCMTSSRRYAHAECVKKEYSKCPEKMPEIIDPQEFVLCCFCNKTISKKDKNTHKINELKYAHKECWEKEEAREKTDEELLDIYIMEKYETLYVPPNIKKQINQFVQEYGYTYSGIQKALIYFYDIKGNAFDKNRVTIGIVPYIYSKARSYYFSIWLANQTNNQKTIKKPKTITVRYQEKPRKSINKKKFDFLNEDKEDSYE